MDAAKKSIWYEWRRMYYRSRTLMVTLDGMDTYERGYVVISNELDELNSQMAELEDDNDPWLAELISDEF